MVMNGVHDMGGMHGFGRVEIEADEPVFHFRWEARVRGLMGRMLGRYYHLDEFRHAIERMPAADYLQASYYERWLHAVEVLLVEKGVVTREELSGGRPLRPLPAERIQSAGPKAIQPAFQAGDRVTTRNLNPPGHTRLPRYARHRSGVVRSVNGPFLLPDANAHGEPTWEPCYAVEFSAAELWGPGHHPSDSVCVDLWESYLMREEGRA